MVSLWDFIVLNVILTRRKQSDFTWTDFDWNWMFGFWIFIGKDYKKIMEDHMTLQQFMKNHNYAPYSLEEVAALAVLIKDKPSLSMAAVNFLDAQEEFKEHLEDIGYEFG